MREPTLPQFDAETYLMWESRQRERFELHHGFVVAFAGGTLDHDRISLNLRVAFDRLFPAPCRSFGSDLKVRIDDVTFDYADAGVVCDDVTGRETIVANPTIVAEVLSPSTRTYDLIEKRAAYRSLASLKAYVIAHTTSPHVDLDVRDGRGGWRTIAFEIGAHPLGADSLAIDEIYARTSLVP